MDKEPVCIDTNLCIDFLRKREPGFSQFLNVLKTYEPCITTITTFELFMGQFKMKRKQDIEGFIKQFLILPFDLASSKESAKLFVNLSSLGKGLDIPDIMIAGICIANKIPLLTMNLSHFSRIAELKVITP